MIYILTMFTGLVEKIGKIKGTHKNANQLLLEIESPFEEPLNPGASIAVNGACLTVIKSLPNSFVVCATSETLKRTNLGKLHKGSLVNLERPIKASDRLEGHFLLGHIDTTGTICSILQKSGNWIMRITYPVEYTRLVVEKGSVGVDGVSLTVVKPSLGNFSVALIPYTLAHTTLGLKRVGESVNLEFDILLKGITGITKYETKTWTFLY